MKKHKSLFKSKLHMIVSIILFAAMIYGFIYLGKMDVNAGKKSDAILFSEEFNLVGTNNVYVFKNASEVWNKINTGNAIVLFGVKNNEWVNNAAKIINETAQEHSIGEIYFYDIANDRYNNNATYESMLLKLKNYVYVDDLNHAELYAPTILVMKNNRVLLFNSDTSFTINTTPEEYWNEEKITEYKDSLGIAFDAYRG